MLALGIGVLLYAALLSTGNPSLLPIRTQPSLRKNNKKEQVRHIAAITSIAALPPAIGGTAGIIFGNTACLGIMLGGYAAWIVCSVIRRKKKNR